MDFFERNIICCDMRVSVDANDLKSWLAIIRVIPSNYQAENASLNNWIAACRGGQLSVETIERICLGLEIP